MNQNLSQLHHNHNYKLNHLHSSSLLFEDLKLLEQNFELLLNYLSFAKSSNHNHQKLLLNIKLHLLYLIQKLLNLELKKFVLRFLHHCYTIRIPYLILYLLRHYLKKFLNHMKLIHLYKELYH